MYRSTRRLDCLPQAGAGGLTQPNPMLTLNGLGKGTMIQQNVGVPNALKKGIGVLHTYHMWVSGLPWYLVICR